MSESAQEILDRYRNGFGPLGPNRPAYPATPEEMVILLQAGATINYLNRDGGNGIFYHDISFNGARFISPTTELIEY